MQDVLELRRRFLEAIAEQAPQIIHDLFERNDSKAWAASWRFLSEWIIEKAEAALEFRSGNRDQAHALRRRWTINQTGNQARALFWLAVIIGTQDPRFQAMITPALRLRGMVNEEEELRAWRQAASGRLRRLRPPPLTLAVFDESESFRYLSEEELFERLRSDPRIRQAVVEYHQAVFHDHPIFGCFRDLDKIRSGQEEKHMKWLIAYIAGASDREIAAEANIDNAKIVTNERRRLLSKLELELEPRKRRPRNTPS